MDEQNQDFKYFLTQGTKKLHQGQPKDALPYLKKAYDIQPDHIDAGINLSGAYILTKRFKKAVDILEPLSDRNPQHSKIWINLGAAYLGNPVLARDKDQIKAINAFERALEIDPAAYSAAYNIGLIYKDRNESEQAAYWFRQAIKHNPQDRDAYRLLEKMLVDKSALGEE